MAGTLISIMVWEPNAVLTPDELVVHLREAGVKCIYLAREQAFRDGTIPITVTYEFSSEETQEETGSKRVREMLIRVLNTIGDQIWFHDRAWLLDWTVEPAFTNPQLNLIPLYDRRVEHKHGDGFNLRNLLFVYEECHE